MNNTLTLGIAIPTYAGHVQYLTGILDSISNSTVLPTQVSVSISSFNEDLDLKTYPFELIITTTLDYKNPSQNRNIAAKNLNTDIISFIDGDDLPHIQRNEFILKSFEDKDVSSLVHDYYQSPVKNESFLNFLYENMDLKVNHNDCIINYAAANSRGEGPAIHHAHVSIRKEIFDKIKYDEDENLKFREDTAFTRTLIENGYKISQLTNKLSQYLR